MVFAVPEVSRSCVVRASSHSSYAHFCTTRRAIYSNTSATPSPVFADVKNRRGPRSGGSGGASVAADRSIDSGRSDVGVAAASSRSRATRLGVIVGALPELVLPVESIVSVRWRGGVTWGSDVDLGSDAATLGSGDARAEWNTSKSEDEGVWYTVSVVCVVVIVPA